MPEARELDESGWARMEEIVATALAARPPRMVRQLGVFVRVMHAAARLRYGRSFAALGEERQAAWLKGFQDSSLLIFRRGFWGLRTLVYMGYYGQPAVREAVGYRAHPDGWSARG